MKKRIVSTFLALLCICGILFSNNLYVLADSEKSAAEIENQINTTYSKSLNSAGRSSFNGWCGAYVGWQLYHLGINTSYVGRDGNGVYDYYSSLSKSSGGYPITKYPRSSYSLYSALMAISNNGQKNVYNILIGFNTGALNSDGQNYGHTIFIHAIINGTVYFSESFSATYWGTYVSEGRVIKGSIAQLSNWYAETKSGSWTEYSFEGAIHFGISDSNIKSSITISGQNAPTVLNVGDRFWFKGTVSSAKPLAYVFATVNDMNGNAVTSKQYFTSAYSVDIASTIDEYLIMQNLPVGKYQYYIDARDSSGYLQTLHSSEFYVVDPSKDSAAPVISNIKVTDVSENGYRITCDVNDGTGISKVTFPTWTEYNGQDDLVWHEAEVSGNKATLYIKASDHNNETGKYNTHIYATDWLGQVSSVSAASDEGIYVGKKTELSIKTQPKTTSAKLGEAAKITVSATGDGLTYTWYFKNPGSSSFTKSGVTTAAYSMTMQQSLSGRQVYCVVTDKYGDSVKTNTVSLNLAATITKQPVTTSAADGSKLTVKIAAVGDELTYQWYYIKPGSSTPVKSGVTSANYNITMKAEYNGRRIYCVVTDKYGNTAKTNTIDIYHAVSIIEQPKNVTVSVGNKASVSVSAIGEGLTYKWYFKNPGEDTYTKSAITSSVYTVTMQSSIAGRQVYCVVTDKYGDTARSNTITISAPSVKITTQPQSATAAVGTAANIKIAASGDSLTYTWYFKNPGSSSYTKSGIKSSTYSVTMQQSISGRQVYCVVADKYGNSVKSNTVTITAPSVKITTQPQNATAAVGTTASVKIAASGSGLTYTWYFKNPGSASYTKSGIKSSTYSVTMQQSISGRQVYCVVADKYGNSVKSNTVTISAPSVKITTQPKSTAAAVGTTASVKIAASGSGLTYTWYFKNPGSSSYTKSGIKSSTYSMTMQQSLSGRQAYCVVTDKYGNTAKSNTVTITAK